MATSGQRSVKLKVTKADAGRVLSDLIVPLLKYQNMYIEKNDAFPMKQSFFCLVDLRGNIHAY